MGRFLTSVVRAIRAGTSGPSDRRYALFGKPIVCPHCGHDRFVRGSALMNTTGMTFFQLDWANREATTLACAECGGIQWFLQTPDDLP